MVRWRNGWANACTLCVTGLISSWNKYVYDLQLTIPGWLFVYAFFCVCKCIHYKGIIPLITIIPRNWISISSFQLSIGIYILFLMLLKYISNRQSKSKDTLVYLHMYVISWFQVTPMSVKRYLQYSGVAPWRIEIDIKRLSDVEIILHRYGKSQVDVFFESWVSF